MEYSDVFNRVYKNYISTRKIKLQENHFMALVTALPALIVAKADGVVDAKEKEYLQQIADNLAIQFSSDEDVKKLSDVFCKEFDYILNHLSDWQIDFIELNAEYLNEHPEKKEEIKKRIIDIAEVSNGICEEEKMFIDHLINTLSL